MAVHWVNYDLNKSGQDYTKLIEYLKSHQSWAKPLKSSFFVKTSLTTSQLIDGIRQRTDANDAIVVVDVTRQLDELQRAEGRSRLDEEQPIGLRCYGQGSSETRFSKHRS